jgi:hypothetical protein
MYDGISGTTAVHSRFAQAAFNLSLGVCTTSRLLVVQQPHCAELGCAAEWAVQCLAQRMTGFCVWQLRVDGFKDKRTSCAVQYACLLWRVPYSSRSCMPLSTLPCLAMCSTWRTL